MQKPNTIQIDSFSFYDFCTKAQEAVLAGYKFSDDNDKFPQAFTGSYSCTMILSGDAVQTIKETTKETSEDALETQVEKQTIQTSQKGRKPNSK